MTAVDGGPRVTGTAQHEAWQRRVLPPVEQVRPGLWSVPVPIPDNPLRYTLSYAFVGDTVLVVDPGWDSAAGREALTAGLAAAGAGLSDVAGVVVTHVHPDHHGLSGWLRGHGAWIAMHPLEARSLPSRILRGLTPAADADWLREHGVPEDELSDVLMRPERIAGVFDMPEPDRLLRDGDALPLTGRSVRAVWTPGHTPGHLCLHDADAGVLLTGDHLLPRITPNIGTHPGDRSEPLGAYLGSLRRFAAFGDDEALPAHEYRFRGIAARAAELAEHHRERGEEIVATLRRLGPSSTWRIAGELTWSRGWAALGRMRRMALGETVTHLRYLVAAGQVAADPGAPALWRAA